MKQIAILTVTIEGNSKSHYSSNPDKDYYNLNSRTVTVQLFGIPIFRKSESYSMISDFTSSYESSVTILPFTRCRQLPLPLFCTLTI